MKLRNKKTGETGYYLHTHRDHKDGHIKVAVLKDGEPFSEFKPYEPAYDYDSLAELCEEWEDYEEPMYYFIADTGEIRYEPDINDDADEFSKRIGNYFKTEEEAEKAVKKLKAWKRLKDKGVALHLQKQFNGNGTGYSRTIYTDFSKDAQEIIKDLDLLFGGEE